MKLLAIETATEACSAALYLEGEVRERYQIAPREHAALILPMCEALLAEAGLAPADLDALAFGRGPGSFTGVRIATGVVQGIAFARGCPVVPVSTLAALAQGALTEGQERVIACIDARMGEVYFGAYVRDARGLAVAIGEERVCAPEEVPLPDAGGWWGVGSGWQTYGVALGRRLRRHVERWEGQRLPRAGDVVRLAAAAYEQGEHVAADRALPVYLRDRVAVKPGSAR